MRLSSFAGAITSMFTDSLSIKRYTSTEMSDGTTQSILPPTPLYSDIRCKLSLLSADNSNSGEMDNTSVEMKPKIFCACNVDIAAGDYVTVTRTNDSGDVLLSYSGKVGLPLVFETHKEVMLYLEGSA